MSKFSIKNQEEKDECLRWISDLYKDVYGFRPRGYNFEAWSFQELTDFVNDLLKQSEEEEEYERQVEEKEQFVVGVNIHDKEDLIEQHIQDID